MSCHRCMNLLWWNVCLDGFFIFYLWLNVGLRVGRSERDMFVFPWMGEVKASGRRGCPRTLSHTQASASFWVLSSWWWYLSSSLSFIQSSPLLCEIRSQVCQFHPENDIYPLLFFCPLSSCVSLFRECSLYWDSEYLCTTVTQSPVLMKTGSAIR